MESCLEGMCLRSCVRSLKKDLSELDANKSQPQYHHDHHHSPNCKQRYNTSSLSRFVLSRIANNTGSRNSHHQGRTRNCPLPVLVVDENKTKLKATLICLESCSCDFIEIHGKSAKYIYVDESPII